MSDESPKPKRPCPEIHANFISNWYYHWLTPFIWNAYRKPLESDDLYNLADENISRTMADEFERHWKELEVPHTSTDRSSSPETTSKTPEHPVTQLRTFKVLWRMFGWRFASIGVFHFLQAAGNIASPVMITQLTQFVINTQAPTAAPPPLWLGIIFALVLFALQLLASATLGRYFYHSSRFGMKVRSVLAAVCYRKMMRLSSLARQQYSGGRIMNMISSDLPRIESTIIQGHYMWSGPLQIAVILAILIYYIGAVALAGFALLILLIPVQALIFIRLGKLRRATASITDRRIKHTEEYFQGIKIIKLFGWELSFLNRLMEMRDAEVSKIRRVNVLTAIVMGIATSFPTFASVISFIAYAALGNALSAPIIFAALAYFSMMRAPLIILPSIIRFAVESKVAMNRLEEFLLAAEVANEFIAHSTDAASDVKDAESQQYAIVMRDCNFSYEAPPKTSPSDDDKKKEGKANGKTQAPSSPTKPTKAVEIGEKQDVELKEVKAEPKIFKLRDLNVKIKRGQLIAVVGPVGCGKTTFLNAILGEVKRESGDISVNGSIGYSLQNPWIQNGTLRKNVLFGNPFDEHRYQTVVEASALSKDLEWLPGGSDTLLGEKGVQISGGQKARVSLARLMYCSPDIALLDDPLSAVDIHVGKHIFRECIKGALSGKTIVLATHHLNYLRQCDYIIVLKDGEVREEGTFDDLMSAKGECFRLVSTFAGEETSSSATDAKAASATKANTSDSAKTDPAKPEKTTKALKMTEEERVIGSVSGAVYREYLKAAAGPMLFAMIAILIILAQCSRVGNDVWLAVWSSNRFPELGAGGYSGFYFGWGFMQGSTAAVLGVVLSFAFARASVSLHRNALQGVFVAPMKFFDTTPLGRIVNRFSRDTDTMDAQLPSALQMFISIFASLVSTLILMIVALPYLLIGVAPLLVVYYFMQRLYVRTSRELKRLESISRSPIYSHFGESLTGLSSIRAYRKQSLFTQEIETLIDTNNQASYLQIITQRWLSVRLDLIGAIICFLTALIGVLTAQTFSASIFGLVLTYSLQVTLSLNFSVRQAVEVEVNANSIERLHHYSNNLEHEASWIMDANRPPQGWPQAGQVQVRDLVIKYNEKLEPVINNLSFTISAKQKVGIVGRTGAGKSTITAALFRLMEPVSGQIFVDDVDISAIGLHDLRTHLAIIPQDPVLFSGTVRSNLDPFNEYEDTFIWEVLAGVNMKEAIANLPDILESKVEASGENFSTGQRQLLCLARAMLRRPRVLIMDEATASVDMESDQIIQTSIRRDFKESTVITIAHRLHTVIDYDKVMVLDQGHLVEYDSPHVLLQREGGVFREMVERTGPASSQALFKLAKAKHDGIGVGVETLLRSSAEA